MVIRSPFLCVFTSCISLLTLAFSDFFESIAMSLFSSLGICPASTLGCSPLLIVRALCRVCCQLLRARREKGAICWVITAAYCCHYQNTLSLIFFIYDQSLMMAQVLQNSLGCTASFSSSYLHCVAFKALSCFRFIRPWIFVSNALHCTAFSHQEIFAHSYFISILFATLWPSLGDLSLKPGFSLLLIKASLFAPVSLFPSMVKCRWSYFSHSVSARIKCEGISENAMHGPDTKWGSVCVPAFLPLSTAPSSFCTLQISTTGIFSWFHKTSLSIRPGSFVSVCFSGIFGKAFSKSYPVKLEPILRIRFVSWLLWIPMGHTALLGFQWFP